MMRMKKISLVGVFLVSVAAAQKDCFCPGGFPLEEDRREILINLSPTTETTCGVLEEESKKSYLIKTYGCNYYRYYGHLCGCHEPKEPIQKCDLCQDGQDIPLNVQRSAGLSECEQYAIEAKFDPFRQGCGYYNFLGSLCGCTKNRPPFEGCTLCGDGSDPPLASSTKQVSVAGVEGGTCQNVGYFTRYVQKPDTWNCIGSQATLGNFCGCDPLFQPESNCPLCLGEDMAVSNDVAPDFNYLNTNGHTKIHQSGLSCLEAEMLAHQLSRSNNNGSGKETCSAIRAQLAEACCHVPKPAATVSTTWGSTPSAAASTIKNSVPLAAAVALGTAIHGLCHMFF